MRTLHFVPALALMMACATTTPDGTSNDVASSSPLAEIGVGVGNPADLPADQLAPPGFMRLATPDAFVLGTQVRVGVLRAPPSAPVYLIGSLANGGTQSCPPQLAPVCLDLFNPIYVLGQTTSNGAGQALFLLDLPPNLPLVTAHLQAASRTPGDRFTSNVLDVTFEAPVDTDTDLPPTVATVPDLRSGAAGVAVGDIAEVTGLVVTAVGFRGFTAQDPSASSNGGIYVYHNGELSGFAVGDVVSVVGTYDEYGTVGAVPPLATLAELQVLAAQPGTSITVTGSGSSVSPVVLDLGDASQPTIAETYESMLVTLDDTAPLEMVGPFAFDEFPVAPFGGADEILIDNEFFSLSAALPDLDVGATFNTISGPMYFSFGAFKVAPRSLADVTGYAPPPGDSDTDTDTDTDTTPPLPGPDTLVAGDLVITEFMANPSLCSDTDGEYFEVLYRGSQVVNLAGLIMEDSANTAVLAGPVVANPGDRLVFGPQNGSFSTCYPTLVADGLFPFGLNNTGDLLRLSNAGGVIAEVDFRTWTIGNGVSWEQDDAVVPDSGTWCFADATEIAPNGDLGTPDLANGACPVIIDTDTDTDVVVDTDLPPTAANLIMTEVMDYGPDFNLRFVEIYNAEASAVDLSTYAVLRYSNGGTTPTAMTLSGSVAAGDVWVLGTAVSFEAAYDTAFGGHPDQYNSGVNGNGDDVYALGLSDGVGGWVIVDVYGTIGVDGTGLPWEYTDKVATRNCGQAAGTATFDVAQWAISTDFVNDASLGSWPCP